MASKRMNVLIYAGSGATVNSVRHATYTLRRLLGQNYAVLTVTAEQILKEPWTASCALLVMPGGADMAYCRTLNGEGNRRIKQYVQLGGAYLGLCAGGYYGCNRCEFEVGKRGMEVIGDRELDFYPGVCRGLAFPGFVYASEAGARAVELVPGASIADVGGKQSFKSYYNGGGVFVDAPTLEDRGVEVLATYSDDLAVNPGKGQAAVVLCKVGDGSAILTSPHPEFAPTNLNRDQPSHPNYGELVDALLADDQPRTAFMKACLTKLGLEVTQGTAPVPSLSRLHLSSSQPSSITELVQTLSEARVISRSEEDGEEYIVGENDTFRLEQVGRWNMSSVADAVKDAIPQAVKDKLPSVAATSSSDVPQSTEEQRKSQAESSPDRILDYNAITKQLVAHESGLPDGKETPFFHHAAFFASLKACRSKHRKESSGVWGNTLMYGEVVTSTNTILEKNPTLLSHLPDGFTATATTQVAGRGRGTNVWVSPPGSLMFSIVLRHSIALSNTAPVVFVQYLAALAIVAGIKTYDRGYDKLPVRLKWPNDIYARDPSQTSETYSKVGGILVNSSYAGGDYTLVIGIGINVNNSRPSLSLSQLAQVNKLPAFTLEKLLASIITHFEEMYTRFCRSGFDGRLEQSYYDSWLHTDQIVTLETEGGARARIKGITRQWGLLVAEELGWEDRPTGKRWELQSDSNSFDFFKGLLKRKT